MPGTDERLDLWYAGLPLVERRTFTEDERQKLEMRLFWYGWAAWLSTAYLAAQFVIMPVIRYQISVDGVVGALAAINMFFLVLCVGGIFLHLPRYEIARVLRAKELLVFEGALPQVASQASRYEGLGYPGERMRVEVPHGSRKPWTVNGNRPGPLDGVPTVELAKVAPVPVEAAPRSLTAEERLEIEQYIGRLRWRHWNALVLVGLGGISLTLSVIDGKRTSSMIPGAMMLATGLFMYLLASGLQEFLSARQLKRDLARNSVIADPDDPDVLLLAESKMAWIVQGQPAAWRTFLTSMTLPFNVKKVRKPIVISAKPN